MASRSKSDRRSDSGSDSMEAIKPLIVLVLFGTILYGAYSVVQKGPSTPPGQPAASLEAPPFAPPAAEMPQQPLPPASSPAPTGPTGAPPSSAPAAAVAPAVPAAPPVTMPAATPPAALPHADAPVAAAAIAGVASPAVPVPVAVPDAAAARASDGPPTYLAAESARPPAQDDVAAASGPGDDRPDRLASATSATLSALPPEMPPPPGSLPSSAAFTTAWANAHDNLASGRYAEALTSLSVWYDDRSLSLEESQRLEDLLGQLAGTVIYSQQDLLLPPYVVTTGETLPAIAAPLGVSWRLLAKINGIADPMQLVPGEQ
ncbi:MAG: LysM peptidoglycan-binding domain-containing protein, partial [Planctomycetes bacterium]|nr:LysM peptidoglycan-binding domain-containing protein [Planctomycetota bacterium]